MLDTRTYNLKKEEHAKEQQNLHQRRDSQGHCDVGYDSSDDESCDLENGDYDTMSSCRSKSRSCCSVTTVANDDFEYFQRKGTKVMSHERIARYPLRVFPDRISVKRNPRNPKTLNSRRMN